MGTCSAPRSLLEIRRCLMRRQEFDASFAAVELHRAGARVAAFIKTAFIFDRSEKFSEHVATPDPSVSFSLEARLDSPGASSFSSGDLPLRGGAVSAIGAPSCSPVAESFFYLCHATTTLHPIRPYSFILLFDPTSAS